MIFKNITLGSNVEIDPSTSINNVIIKDGVRIAKRCSIYGGPSNQLEIGENGYIGMNTILNGYSAKLTIGDNVSISQFVNIMVDSGPNASPRMLKIFPIEKGPVTIGNDCWIGASVIIMPNVALGEFCVVASNSFVNKSFPAFSIIGGSPAKIIRSFTNDEKEKMIGEVSKVEPLGLSAYEFNYLDLPFEDVLRQYRKNNIYKAIRRYPHSRFLEIGCGPYPLFQNMNDYDEMTVIEPAITFFEMAESMAKEASNVVVINNLVENLIDILKNKEFDFIVIGGFIHEIDNPDAVLKAVRLICSKNTIVYSFVPNAKSFHRLLADKMGLIDNIYQKSDHDELFERKNVYEKVTFNDLFVRNKFKVIDSGSYFVKPFSHHQMDHLISNKFLIKSILDGLDKMIDFMPDFGAEIWNISKIDD